MADEEHYLDRILPLRRVLIDGKFRRDVRYLEVKGEDEGVTVAGQTMTLDLRIATADNAGLLPSDLFSRLDALDAWEVTDLELPLVVTGAQFTTVASDDLEEDGYLALPLAPTGHGDNGLRAIFIPAGTVTGLRKADDENTDDWATYDASKDCIIWIGCVTSSPRRFWSALQMLGIRDSAAPTLSSATVDGSDADKLVLVFSEPVWLRPDLVGLSITGSPSVTISAIVSGNGTDTITLDLSRDLTEDDDGNLTLVLEYGLDDDKHQDMNGNTLAAFTEPLTLENFRYTLPGEIFDYSGDSTTYDGSDHVTAVANGTAGATNFGTISGGGISGTISKVTSGTGKFGWQLDSTSERFTVDAAAQVVVTSGSLMIVCETENTTGAYEFLVALGKHSSLTTAEIALLQYGSLNILTGRTNSGGTGDATGTGPGTALHCILMTWDTSERNVYIDGVLAFTSATDTTPADCRRLALGHDCNTLNGSLGNMKIYCVKGSPTKLTAGAQVTAGASWSASFYGTPPPPP